MKAYLCSSPYNSRSKLYKRNSFLKKLRKDWPNNANVLYISSDPDNYMLTDKYTKRHQKAYEEVLSVASFKVIDHRTQNPEDYLKKADVLVLAGGHCPTQMAYFRELKLKDFIKDFEGILIGCSAGTMNMEKIVYSIPELENEAIDPNYQRFYEGLGLADIYIVPHFSLYRDYRVDGLRLIEDIACEDSYKIDIHFFNDSTYLYLNEGKKTIYGETYLMSKGQLRQILKNSEKMELL